jgi:hypothetical protein
MKKKIDYAKIGSVLRATGTHELEESVKRDIMASGGQMSFDHLIQQSEKLEGGIDWNPKEPTSEEKRKIASEQFDKLDSNSEPEL